MEPRQQWRGNVTPIVVNIAIFACFNGAAPTMARKRWARQTASRRCESFNGAAPTMARKHFEFKGVSEDKCQLQWSRANNGAETPFNAEGLSNAFRLQWSRANNGAETTRRCLWMCLVLKLQWSRANNGAETSGMLTQKPHSRICFNGAAPTMARKPNACWRMCRWCARLQWSRANNGAETIRGLYLQFGLVHASMEPRQQWRGNFYIRHELDYENIASMEPRQQWRGNALVSNPLSASELRSRFRTV